MIRKVTAIAISAIVGLGVATSQVNAEQGYERQVIDLTNQQRVAHGCGSLAENSALDKAARGHSREMAATNNMSHYGPNGSTVGDRLARVGYPAKQWAENVAYGQATPKEVVNAWMNSSGHRANILNCQLAEIGVGHAKTRQGVPYWTQDFGTR